MRCLKFLLNLMNAVVIKVKILLYITLSNCKMQIKIINLKFAEELK